MLLKLLIIFKVILLKIISMFDMILKILDLEIDHGGFTVADYGSVADRMGQQPSLP